MVELSKIFAEILVLWEGNCFFTGIQ